MKLRRLLFTILFFVVLPQLYAAEHTNFHFKNIQVDEGLSENTVFCILQDSKGYIWFGTKDGLNRFDGTNFRVFRHDDANPASLGNNFIRSLLEGEDGNFYIGTDVGLYIMDTADETFTLIRKETTDGTRLVSAINNLFADKDGTIWIASMYQGVFTYIPSSGELKKVELMHYNLGNNAVWCIYGDRSGTIWLGTRFGLLRYNRQTNLMEAVDGLFNPGESSGYEILCMFEDIKGNLWLGTWANGLWYYNKQTYDGTTFFGLDSKDYYVTHMRAIFQYDTNRLLIGSDDGLYLFNTETHEATRVDVSQSHYSLSDQNVYSIARDREGGIWIGTYFGGINYLNASLLPIETYYPDMKHGMLSGRAVSQFCEDRDGNMWIATEDGGVNFLEVKTRRITQPIQTSYHNTHALLLDGDDLWIGTFSRGIDIYNTRTGKLVNYRANPKDESTLNDDCVFLLYKTRNGDIYAGTPAGLNKFDREKKQFIRIPEAHGFAYDMKEDETGNLWIANYGAGVIRFDANTRTWKRYEDIVEDTNPIHGSKLTSVYIDSQKRLIFTSEGRGLFIYDYLTDSFRNISEADGLPNNVVYGVLDDAFGNLWISCNKGIVCLDINNPREYKLYNKEDGLQSNQFNYKSSYKTHNGKFYFGGINGFNSFYPQELSLLQNNHIPPVEITNIRLLDNNKSDLEQEVRTRLNKKQRIVLPYNKSSFSISYISLSYCSQNKNQYAYMLEGTDKSWTTAGNNKSVTYVNLSPGTYVFRVKASNNSNIWNDEGARVEIEILPPFWLSLPARLIYAFVLVAGCYLIFSHYKRKYKRKQTQQLEAYKDEQEKLAIKSRIDFFTNIAHEIRTPISLIKAPLEEILVSGDGNRNTRQNLAIIEKNSNQLSVLINQLLDFRKMDSMNYTVTPESINLKNYIGEIYERFRKTTQSKEIDFVLQTPEEQIMPVISDPDALTKVVGNLLTNAIKFTTNRIILTLERVDDCTYSISVEDNGQGIPDEQKKLIFDPFYQIKTNGNGTGIGLSLAKNLAHLLKGSIEVINSETGGSVFRFTFTNISTDAMVTTQDTTREEPLVLNKPDNAQSPNERKNTILVVDDNPEITSFIKDCLQNEYQVDTALSATNAWTLLGGEGYDLIISDIMMPDVDGISFTKRIKADLNYSHIPVILLSAKTDNAVKIEGLTSGAEVFMEKPFSTTFLKAQIHSLLENRRTILESFNRSPLASYSSLVTNKSDEAFLNKLNDEIEKHLSDESFSVESLTDVLGVSRSNLQRKLKGICGSTPGDYLRNYRLRKACKLLVETDMRINEVAFDVGFNSASYFTKVFMKTYNMTPKEFVNGKKGV